MGFTKTDKGITYREWAPAAQQAYLFGDFNGWCGGRSGPFCMYAIRAS